MPRSKDEVDRMSLGAHHILHRSCRGKAHGSGIAKQNNRRTVSTLSSQKSPKSPSLRDPSRQPCVPSNGIPGGLDSRKHSRNSTSSWECSDSDSMHSTEIGQNGCPSAENRSPSINSSRGRDRTPTSVRLDAKERSKGVSRGVGNHCPPLAPRGVRGLRKECWADTLRAGCIDDRIRRMEEGWDDSNVIRTPKERKWHRITAEIEQRLPSTGNGLRALGVRSSWANNSKKVAKRSRGGYQRCARPIQDIVEWEELFEMALARKIRRKIRGKGDANGPSATEGAKDGGESGRAKDEGECMKRLEILLENRAPPKRDEVRFATNLHSGTEKRRVDC